MEHWERDESWDMGEVFGTDPLGQAERDTAREMQAEQWRNLHHGTSSTRAVASGSQDPPEPQP